MAVPQRGSCWSRWAESIGLEDFAYLHDEVGNGLNLSGLSYTWFHLLGDSPVDGDKPYRVCSNFYAQISNPYRLPHLIKEYAELGSLLLHGLLVSDGKLHYEPLFRQFARTPIFREYRAWIRNRDPKLFSFILSFLWFGRKAAYHKGDELTAPALNGWLQVEEDIRSVVYHDHLLEDLRVLIGLSGFIYDRSACWPEHGPRQVAEKLSDLTVHNKNMKMRLSPDVRAFLARMVQAHIESGLGVFVDLLVPDFTRNMKHMWYPEVARLAFVPKDYKSVRTICMEPLGNMWAQQAVLKALNQGLRRSRFATIIDLKDQSKNRSSAVLGSKDRSLATLDLREASDRLAWRLISAIMPPEMVADLELVRTSRVKILNTPIEVEVAKALPMGAAPNSWLQSVVFATFVALAHVLRRKGLSVRDYLSEGMSVVRRFPDMDGKTRVFGDDIIVEEKFALDVILLLEASGFKVNKNKCFTGNQAVRESCGVYALNGDDVTPLLFKIKGLEHDNHESWFSTVAMANASYDRGWLNARTALLKLVPKWCWFETAEDAEYSNSASAVKGKSVELCHVERWASRFNKYVSPDRWNPDLQRWEREVFTVVDEQLDHYGDEWEYAPLAQANVAPIHDDLEAYFYGNQIHKLSERKEIPLGGKASPRDGLSRAVQATWRWVPIKMADKEDLRLIEVPPSRQKWGQTHQWTPISL